MLYDIYDMFSDNTLNVAQFQNEYYCCPLEINFSSAWFYFFFACHVFCSPASQETVLIGLTINRDEIWMKYSWYSVPLQGKSHIILSAKKGKMYVLG